MRKNQVHSIQFQYKLHYKKGYSLLKTGIFWYNLKGAARSTGW
jgi:hypothetical protein